MFPAKIRTKNFSSVDLRGNIMLPFRSVVRLGSTTPTSAVLGRALSLGKRVVECNTVESIENSRNKLRMKECFAQANVPQSDWWTVSNGVFVNQSNQEISPKDTLPYPILVKRVNGFKGHGMFKIDNVEQLDSHMSNNSLTGSYIEDYKNFGREYRLHCSQDECFMTWRKLRRADTPEDRRWFFNSENCNWVSEAHELFDKPTNWDTIVGCCLNAMRTTGLDIGSFDVRVQSNKIKDPQFVLIEVNSAAALAEQGIQAYKVAIAKVLNKKYYETH